MEDLLPLIVQLVTGAIGGNVAGKLLPSLSLGSTGNSIVGILGGGMGGQILGALDIASGGGMSLMGILGSVASGGVGGGVLLTVIGIIRNALKSK